MTQRHWTTELWRGALYVGLLFAVFGAVADLILTDWRGAWHSVAVACGFAYVIRLERTLDRWEPFVPPSMRGRP